ncbi:hypothetical protein Halhy_5175 [Haliscomenobacter hydrossis DSM 1100]|uniref:Uncharacterized protein n=1 Tax=Haliscomenobacter hydrossis (strain ATCC 27775 / DSM 1100 / LMG 10767 / O) TaxID=760192 RepID=F4L4Q3_HALH1|nr:hypothetical protein Halhy_5175 [Haliscomenobacter hydrossis DSM 1100]
MFKFHKLKKNRDALQCVSIKVEQKYNIFLFLDVRIHFFCEHDT